MSNNPAMPIRQYTVFFCSFFFWTAVLLLAGAFFFTGTKGFGISVTFFGGGGTLQIYKKCPDKPIAPL